MNKTLILDSRINESSKQYLSKLGFCLTYIPENICLDRAICAHPDIYMTKVNNTWFIDKVMMNYLPFIKDAVYCDREVICKEKIKYPQDCSFNCVQIGNLLMCNEKITNRMIIDFAKKNGIKVVNVKQGYTKCSICKVNDNSIITEDKKIYIAAIENGLNALLIQKGYVRLDGYDYGFIGGCTGLIEKDLLAFNGNINLHPDSLKIIDFCEIQGVNTISLNDSQLYDVGSIMRL